MPDRLKAYRKRHNLTQQQLADRLGIAKNYVWMLETNKKPPSKKIADELDRLEKSETAPPLASGSPGAADASDQLLERAAELRRIADDLESLARAKKI